MPKLFLIPSALNDEDIKAIPSYVAQIAGGLRVFFVEEEKTARRFLKKLCPSLPVRECEFFELSEHTKAHELVENFKKINGRDCGVVSEAGCPCVADPGADIVLLAHWSNIDVVPLSGPSSFLLALMASGLNGQNFAFNGYLPKDPGARAAKLKELERRSFLENQTQMFMETPYRSRSVFEEILKTCGPDTLVCLASDLTGPNEFIKTLPVKDWKKTTVTLERTPAVFLMQKPQ